MRSSCWLWLPVPPPFRVCQTNYKVSFWCLPSLALPTDPLWQIFSQLKCIRHQLEFVIALSSPMFFTSVHFDLFVVSWFCMIINGIPILLTGAWVRVAQKQLQRHRQLRFRYPGTYRSWHQVWPWYRYLRYGLLRGSWQARYVKRDRYVISLHLHPSPDVAPSWLVFKNA